MRAFLLHSHEPGIELLLERLRISYGEKLTAVRLSPPFCIIHWGAYHPDKGDTSVLQPVKSVLAALQPKRVVETLQLHGIAFADENESTFEGSRFIHDYVVPVFHLQALTLFYRAPKVFYGNGKTEAWARAAVGLGIEEQEYEELGLEQPGYYAVRAMREAIKAIYALGLDYGVIRVGVNSVGKLAVRRVEAVPTLTPRMAELFAEAMNRFDDWLEAQARSGKREVMLGADPEFLLLNTAGKVKFASQFVEKEGPFGCDAIVLPSRRKVFPLAELRPAPSTDVRRLIIHLHQTMQLAAKRIPDSELIWVAGGMPVHGFPLGGHIHFSGIELGGRLLRVLDNYIALPLVLLEDSSTAVRKPQYGFLGDFRRQRHGGFEYRVLPSWMVSPVVAKGVLALAKLTAENYMELNQRPLGEPEIVKAYYRSDKQRIRPLISALWRDIERLPDYADYESYLLPLRRLMLQMRAWNERADIRPKWKIAPFS